MSDVSIEPKDRKTLKSKKKLNEKQTKNALETMTTTRFAKENERRNRTQKVDPL